MMSAFSVGFNNTVKVRTTLYLVEKRQYNMSLVQD